MRGEGERSGAEGAGAPSSRSWALGDDAVDASGRRSRQDPRWAVSVEGLWERFRIAGDRPPTLKERLFTFRRAEYRTFEALRDVSLRIRHGESVALIGHNGSGKSTLLKCIAGILPADEGSVRVDGRLATLLELGAGFHPDLSGRENVYLNGAILGLTRREVDRSFDAIVDFAGVAEFIDMPVRNYSSGMYVRLGFAIAVHVDPDVLLVDEVLSVGDAAFQEKSLARMRGFGERGKTVVLVSHDLSSVRALCERTVVLDHARVAFDGPTTEAIEYYEDLVASGQPAPDAQPPSEPPRRTGDTQAHISHVALLRDGRELSGAVQDPTAPVRKAPAAGAAAPGVSEGAINGEALPAVGGSGALPDRATGGGTAHATAASFPVLASGATVQLVVALTAQEAVREAGSLSLGIAVRRPDMPLYVYETRTAWRGVYLAPPRAGATAAVTFTLDLPVLTGEYLVDLLLANASTGVIHDRWQEALRFSVTSPEHEFGVAALDARIGVANPDGWWPPDLHAPPPERGGPRHHPLREDRPSPGYEPDVPRVDPLVSR